MPIPEKNKSSDDLRETYGKLDKHLHRRGTIAYIPLEEEKPQIGW